jgi:hypothetical protein
VSAPWCVKLNEDILLVIENNLVVVLGDNNSDWAVLRLWDSLRLDRWIDLSIGKVINKLANVLRGDLLGLVVWELLVLGGLLDGECGPLVSLEVKVASVLSEGLGVNGSEVDLALVLLSDGLELLGECVTLLCGLGEDVGERKTGLGRH